MAVDIRFWIINGTTLALAISPLFLIVPRIVATLLVVIVPSTVISLYRYFSLPKCRKSASQFKSITLAHRGGQPLARSTANNFPENTMAAYRWASGIDGINGIELDVWLSRDLIPMVCHDAFLEHTFANCRQFISSLTCAELKQLKYLNKNNVEVADQIDLETIPTLEEVILFLEPTKLKLMIEIKELDKINEMAKVIHNLFERYPFLYDRAFCAAFNPYNLYAIRRLNVNIVTAFLCVPDITKHMIKNAHQTPKPCPALFAKNVLVRWILDAIFRWLATPAGLKFLGADLICMEHHEISKNLLSIYEEAQVVVCAWVVNEPEQRRWLKANDVTIITDTLFDAEHA